MSEKILFVDDELRVSRPIQPYQSGCIMSNRILFVDGLPDSLMRAQRGLQHRLVWPKQCQETDQKEEHHG